MRVNTNGLTYRYYRFIRWMLGFLDEGEDHYPASLCPYVQAMFWGSIFIVVFSPGLILGWITMKLGRLMCKLENPVTDRIVNYIGSHTKFIELLDDGPTDFTKSPIWTGLGFFVIGIASLIGIAGCLAAVVGALGFIGFGVWNFVDIVSAIFSGVAWCLSQIFMGAYWCGFAFREIYTAIIWLFTNGELWHKVLVIALQCGAWLLGIGLASVALCSLFIVSSKLSFVKSLGRYFTNRLNGFSEAQGQRRERFIQAQKKLPPWKCEYCGYKNNRAIKLACVECDQTRPKPVPKWLCVFVVFYPFVWAWKTCAGVANGIKAINVAGPLTTFWSYLVAIKKGVCPLLEFVDPVQERLAAQAAAKERMDTEKNDETSS